MLAESILRNIRSVFSLLLSFFNILFIFWGKILNIFLYQPSFFSKALQKSVLNRVIGFISNCNKFCNIFFNNYYLLLFFCRILPESRCKWPCLWVHSLERQPTSTKMICGSHSKRYLCTGKLRQPSFFLEFWAFCSHFYLLLERGKSEGKCIRILQSAHVKTAKFE